MIRFLLVAIFVISFLIISSPIFLLEKYWQKKDPDKSRQRCLAIVQWAFRVVLFLSGTKVIVKGLENIPKDKAVLYVGNHRSYFDVVIGYTLAFRPTGFVAKKEMESIPLLSGWMHRVCCLFLDRDNLKEGLKTILQGIQDVKNGISLWIFPEGTRNRQPLTELMDFKEGSLKIAEKSGCPIIPVAFYNTAEIFEDHLPRIKAKKVTVQFGEPIILKELDKETRKFSGAYVRSVIIDMLNEAVAKG